MIETCSPVAKELIDLRGIFLSKYAHRTHGSYVLSQFKNLEQDQRNHGRVRWKYVTHLIRLQLSGIRVFTRGFVPLDVGIHRERRLAIRRGELAWGEVEAWRLALHQELDDALASTALPDQPDYGCANNFLIRARQFAARTEYGAV